MAVKDKDREGTGTAKLTPDVSTTADTETLRQEIALRAYHKYFERGCAPGCDQEDWLAAEREVLAARATPAGPLAASSAD
jgi:hypothetical protein